MFARSFLLPDCVPVFLTFDSPLSQFFAAPAFHRIHPYLTTLCGDSERGLVNEKEREDTIYSEIVTFVT